MLNRFSLDLYCISLDTFVSYLCACPVTIINTVLITLVNTQNVSATKIVDSSSIQHAKTKYDLRIQFLALVVMIHEVWLNAQNSYMGRDTRVNTALPDDK